MDEPSTDHLLHTFSAAWLEANRQAVLSSNAWVEAHGLPLQGCRLF